MSSMEPPVMETIDLEILRSQLKELSEAQVHLLDLSRPTDSNRKLLEECANHFLEFLLYEKIEQMESEDANVVALGLEDLEAYLEKLKEEVCSVGNENITVSSETDALLRILEEDSITLEGDLEAFKSTFRFIDSQVLHFLEADVLNWRTNSVDSHESLPQMPKNYEFEILELDRQIEKRKANLISLQDLDENMKRVEAVGQIADMLSAVRVIDSEGNLIRLSLKTPINLSDGSCSSQNFNCFVEPSVLEHELLIEVVRETTELKNVEIFPGDICLDEIIHTVQSSRHMSMPFTGSSLEWLVREVQHRIFFCAVRRLIVRSANKSRQTFEYLDRDETIIAHLVGGIDAFLKIPEGWPITSSALRLISMRAADISSKSISLSFICKVKDLANSLDLQTRYSLSSFVGALEEILIREMHSELHSSRNTN